ncbi:MAG TPA: hypothetical protein EYM65_02665 [Dehalococcoidia bacterium]|nr:hypothetical protein [Dehalococcoidia bacterium]
MADERNHRIQVSIPVPS